MKRNLKRWVSLLLMAVMLITMVPVTASAANESDTFYRIFHLDVGRKYFTVDQVKGIIDTLHTNHYTHMELAIGNDGLRLLLDDMSVSANGTTYDSDKVKAGIQQGNKNYSHAGEWSQTEMDGIISYAQSKNIEIIPLVNTPGHMDAILDTMEAVGISNPAYNNSARTVDVTNSKAVAFTQALVQKYINYFAGKGCKFFHLGCDEYANDKYSSGAMGFGQLQSSGQYGQFVEYVNKLASLVTNAGMTPMAFNDGIYFNNNTTSGTFDSNIVITYWTSGWTGYSVASASTLANKGHKIINTNDAWYYVLGRATGNTYSLVTATSGVKNTKVTDVPGNNDPTPIGCMSCVWCDTASASYSSTEESNIKNLISTLAENNPTYFVASTGEPDAGNGEEGGDNSGEVGGDSDASVIKEITINVGDTAVVEVEGKDVSGTYTTEDTTIATVESAVYKHQDAKEETTLGTKVSMSNDGTYTGVISDGTNYLILDSDGKISNTRDITKATEFTVVRKTTSYGPIQSTNYIISNAGGYYLTMNDSNQLSTSTDSSSWSYSDGFYQTKYYGYYSYYLNNSNGTWQTTTSSSNKGALYSVSQTTTPAIDKTTITFKGISEGTTTVEIGGVTYKLNVVDKVPDNAMTSDTLTLENWITNVYALREKENQGTRSETISATEANSKEGVAISDFAPEEAYANFDDNPKVYYWQSVRLANENKQTLDAVDRTASGTKVTHVRYYNNAWQYKTSEGIWKYFLKNDQFVAYYLQKTDLTEEIITYSKDWGYKTDETTANTSSGKGQVALSAAVVYPDMSLSPTEENIYANSTTIFNYWSGRDIGLVAPVNNSDYEISKITVTDGTRDSNSSANVWYPSDSITWKKVTNEAGNKWYDETVVWDETMETEPMVNGSLSNITWSAKNTAKLVLIYLKPVHHETNLKVNYVDDSANSALIHDSEVVVAYEGVEEPITFLNGLQQKSEVKVGTFTLDDDAYIVNSSDVKQSFNKDITIIQGVDPKYTSGLYEYTGADLSADGKTLTLHYNINSAKLSKNYIVDFGLPVNVPLSDLVEHSENVSKVEVTSGSAVVNTDKSITYTPEHVLSGSEAVRVKVYFANSSETFTIGFTPATTVYYEETFATFENGTNKGTAINSTQKKSLEGSKDYYGYDAAYADDGVKASNGTYVELGTGGKGEFTFNGTGVDVYANSTPNTGKVMLYLYQGETLKKLYTVDTKMANGNTGATNQQNVKEAYNVPIVTIKGLESGTYTVKMEVVKTKVTAEDGTTSKVVLPVNIDGFRVYGTLLLDSAAYQKDLEDNPEYYQLRDMVLNAIGVSGIDSQYGDPTQLAGQVYDASAGATGIITDESVTYADSTTVKDLLDNGPKNEIYLYANQTLTFKVQSSRLLQLGMKALNASTDYTLKVDGKEVKAGSMDTSVDMFYKLNEATAENHTYTVSVTNNGTGILSITDLKICDDPNAAFVELTAEDIEKILVPTEYADATLNIALNDAAGNSLATTALTANGEVGETATFTAAAIEEAVATLVPEGYELKEVSYADQEVAYGEEASVTFIAEEIQEEQPTTSVWETIVSVVKNIFDKLFGWF